MAEAKKEEKNYYKYATFALLGLLGLAAIIFLYNVWADSHYNAGVIDGRQLAVNTILSEVINKGSVNIAINENTSVTLVSATSIGVAQENLVGEILTSVKDNGFVQFTLPENQSVVLVPYVPEQQ